MEEVSQGRGDFFSFEINPAKRKLVGPKYAGYRFAVEASIGTKRFERFQIDVAVGDPLIGELVSAQKVVAIPTSGQARIEIRS